MNSLTITVLAGLLSAAAVVLITRLPVVRPATWADEYGTKEAWSKLSWKVMGLSLGALLVALVGLHGTTSFAYALSVAMSTGVVGVAVMYSLVTDLKLRKVDRRVLNWALLAGALAGAGHLAVHWSLVTAVTALSVFLVGGLIYLFVMAIGASDARAFMVIGLALVPPLGYYGFMVGTYIMAATFIVGGLGTAAYMKKMKLSYPAVPMLLAPYWLTLIASAFMAFGPAHMLS